MVYAEINEDGKAFAVSDFGNGVVDKPTLIPLDSYDTDVLGKIWTGTEWIDDPTPIPEPEIIDGEIPKSVIEEKLDVLIAQLEPLTNAIRTVVTSSDKIGYDWRITYLGDMELSKEYVESSSAQNYDGSDYLRPITYTVGMSVTEGLWYTDGSDVWVAVKSGTPADFTDNEYFDIVEV